MSEALEILHRHWGYTSFRPPQAEIIDSVIGGRDTLALMPTGGGKSLTYQIPGLAAEGVCIVITPLISLMKDQVDALRRRGIQATSIHSGLSARQIDYRLDNCVYGDMKFLYVSPERLSDETFIMRAGMMHVNLIAVDEAHCISKWGHDFRPSYLRIAELRHIVGDDVPVLALTASATTEVTEDIMKHLEFRTKKIFRGNFARPNLSYVVRKTDDREQEILHILGSVPGCGIVYAPTRNMCQTLADFLRKSGIEAEAYHAGLRPETRAERQERWMSGKTRVMVATSAFGMGIDKADVRTVIHIGLCDSLESYYQEAGRAGRDGRRSYAVMLYSDRDIARQQRIIRDQFPPMDGIKDIYEHICSFLRICIGDGEGHGFKFDMEAFCRQYHVFSGTVINALDILSQNGYMYYIEEAERPARVMFSVPRDALYSMESLGKRGESILSTMLRIYTGIFSEYRMIDVQDIAQKSRSTVEDVFNTLKTLRRKHVIRYIPSNTSPLIHLGNERLERSNLYISKESYSLRQETLCRRFEAMVEYATVQSCRSAFLEDYFIGAEPSPCGSCDNCLAMKRRTAPERTPRS